MLQTAKNVAKSLVPAPAIRALRSLSEPKPTGAPFLYIERPGLLNCCIAYNQFGGYCVPVSAMHRPAAKRVLAGKVWESDTIEFMISQFDSGDIITAGTFFGDFLPALSAHLQPGAGIWAFEPNPESFRCAQITLMLNGLKNVVLTQAGLGAQPEVKQLVVTDTEGLRSAAPVIFPTPRKPHRRVKQPQFPWT